MKRCSRQPLTHRIEGLEPGTRHQQIVAGADDSLGDSGNLFRCFSGPVHDFGEPLSDRSVVVDAREIDILVGRVAQILKELLMCRLRRQSSGPHFIQQLAQLKTVHDPC